MALLKRIMCDETSALGLERADHARVAHGVRPLSQLWRTKSVEDVAELDFELTDDIKVYGVDWHEAVDLVELVEDRGAFFGGCDGNERSCDGRDEGVGKVAGNGEPIVRDRAGPTKDNDLANCPLQ